MYKFMKINFIDFAAAAYAIPVDGKSYPIVAIWQDRERKILSGDRARWYKGDDLPRDEDLEDTFKTWLQDVYAPTQDHISLSLKWWLEGDVEPYQGQDNTSYINDVLSLMERRIAEVESSER
jgi:hypothetical protein